MQKFLILGYPDSSIFRCSKIAMSEMLLLGVRGKISQQCYGRDMISVTFRARGVGGRAVCWEGHESFTPFAFGGEDKNKW